MTHREHLVKQGECIVSIAHRYGLFPETVWDDPKNTELRQQRENPGVLLPGDIVHVPLKRRREESCATEQRHRFRRKGVLQTLRLRLTQDGEARANEPYALRIEGEWLEGETDEAGWLEQTVPPDARSGELLLQDGEEVHPIRLRALDPVDTLSGVQSRLHNLGFLAGEATGEPDDETEEAIRAFQKKHDLSENGRFDDTDLQPKLEEEHGS